MWLSRFKKLTFFRQKNSWSVSRAFDTFVNMQRSINSTFDPINSVMTNSALKCLDFSSFVSSWPFVSISIKKRPRCVCILNSLCALLLEVTQKGNSFLTHTTFPTYLWVTIKGHKDQDLNVDLDLHDSKELCFQKDGWQACSKVIFHLVWNCHDFLTIRF